MKKISFDIEPSEKQMEFFMSEARFTAYGGARGGGKSWALRYKLLLLCLNYPGIRTIIIRRSYPELYENHVLPLLKILEGTSLASYSEEHKEFRFVNGSTIKLGYLSNEKDLLRYQGQEFDIIAIDEATQIVENAFRILCASLRGANDFPKRVYLTCNPGGVGHGFVKRLFIDRVYRKGEHAEDYRFIRALAYDNQALLGSDPGYIDRLEALPEKLRKAWLYGEWDVFEGQFFPEFDVAVHTSFNIEVPENSVRYCSMDYGLDMLACLFIAVDEKGHAYVYDEIYRSDLVVSEAARLIKDKATGDMIFIAPADLWSRQKDSGKSIAELFSENGVYLTKLLPNRVFGWATLKEWLKIEEVSGKPRMTIDRKCENIIRSLPLLMHDRNVCDDVAVTPHEITHAPDALRYFASYRASFIKESTPQYLFRGADAKKKNVLTGGNLY